MTRKFTGSHHVRGESNRIRKPFCSAHFRGFVHTWPMSSSFVGRRFPILLDSRGVLFYWCWEHYLTSDCPWIWNFSLRGCQAAKPRAANAIERTEFSKALREMDRRVCGSWPLAPVRAAWSLEAGLLPPALTSRWGRGPWASVAHLGPGYPFRWSRFFLPSGHMNSLRLFRVLSKEAKALIHWEKTVSGPPEEFARSIPAPAKTVLSFPIPPVMEVSVWVFFGLRPWIPVSSLFIII